VVSPELAVENAVAIEGNHLSLGEERIAVSRDSRLLPIAIGKAAVPMARGLVKRLGNRLEPGVILTKDGHADGAPGGWQVFEASHPVPDQRGVEASMAICDLVTTLNERDVAIVLVSGGGSALLELPKSPLDLSHIQDVTRLMLQAGAPIQDLNAVRSELSEVKGGGLRRLIGRATCISVILSDVLGNDPKVIASGPTISREADPGRALELLRAYGLMDHVPSEVIDLLEREPGESPQVNQRDAFVVVADNDRLVDAVAEHARMAGFQVDVVDRQVEGEAREVAAWFLAQSKQSNADAVIAGGELTVTVRGDGAGGRNTEFALAAALELERGGQQDLVIASLASDGQDGAVDAAGAIVDDGSAGRIRAAGEDPERALDRNDSGSALKLAGDLVVPGPTGTNVNDVYVAIPASPQGGTMAKDS
jgi:hydroxypyruvate reductase